jgi:hypothetical protein
MQPERDKTRGPTVTPNKTNKLTCKKQKQNKTKQKQKQNKTKTKQNKTKNKTKKKAKEKLITAHKRSIIDI